MKDMAERDHRDQNRTIAPLTIPAGAHNIDTTIVNPDEVLALCLTRIQESLPANAADI